jgi:hypothetical protein
MRQKFQAGAELDILTPAEMSRLLREWMVDVARGARPVAISAAATAGADSKITVGGSVTLTGGTMGPGAGFWWAVTRLAVRVDDVPAAYTIYTGEPHTSRLVRDVDASAGGYAAFGSHELLVGNSTPLAVRASGSSTSSRATVTGCAIEFPESLLWKWLAG